MEIVVSCPKKKEFTTTCPCKCIKKYLQPPRAKSFAPKRLYKVPSEQLDTNTTYHLSYLNVDRATADHARSQPIRAMQSLQTSDGKFFDETTSKLSYRPVWQIVKPLPIIPKYKPMTGQGAIENLTTFRYDYVLKHIEKPELIISQGNIRTSSLPLDDRTMTKLSYVHPGSVKPAFSFKPILKYCPPKEPSSKETTQKLSYQPFIVSKKELYPWSKKPVYRQPDVTMCGKTIYSESYMKNKIKSMEQPFLPVSTSIFPNGAGFASHTIYKDSYLPISAEHMEPIIPCNNIAIPDVKMSADTTNKLSYQRTWTEKRKPFIPYSRRMTGTGAMQSETMTRCEYVPKVAMRPDLIIPCNNIRTAAVPLERDTTTGMSYMKPSVITPVQNYKPILRYCRPEIKIDSETINKLSYQVWMPKDKKELPWVQKYKYQPPIHPMANDTTYHMSFPEPGHYIGSSCIKCLPCSNDKQDNVLSMTAEITS